MDINSEEKESATINVEISGDYDTVVSKLQTGGNERSDLQPLLDDVGQLLETVDQLNGGTRSAIADRISEETTESLDAQAVVEILQVLQRYDLVTLEGNTWNPGPALQT